MVSAVVEFGVEGVSFVLVLAARERSADTAANPTALITTSERNAAPPRTRICRCLARFAARSACWQRRQTAVPGRSSCGHGGLGWDAIGLDTCTPEGTPVTNDVGRRQRPSQPLDGQKGGMEWIARWIVIGPSRRR
jgi:hypothetical protein